jgi:EH domain-containing protein 1
LALKGNDSKIHIVLNKADRVTTPQLMRVYGALMWSLGKVINTPEVTRVYIGSFWDEPLHNDEQRKLFECEAIDLYHNLNQLPRGAAVRKLNDLIKRARLAKVHAYILVTLKEKMPSMFGKAKEQEKLRTNLPTIYAEIAKVRQVPVGDFPDAQMMSEKLKSMDFSKFKKIDLKKLSILETMLSTDLPRLLQLVPAEMEKATPAQHQAEQTNTPFATSKAGGLSEANIYQNEWLRAPPNVEDYRKDFEKIDINGTGKVSGGQAKDMMVQSKLPSNVLHKIWTLADVDKDGALSVYEFSLAMHFIKMRLDGQDLPPVLPAHLACPISTE